MITKTMKALFHWFQRILWVLYPCSLIGLLHFCYHRFGGGDEQSYLMVFGISIAHFSLIYFCEYYDDKQGKIVVSCERSVLMGICILFSHGWDICFHGYGWGEGLISFLFLSCIAVLLWERIERSKVLKKIKQEQTSNKKRIGFIGINFLMGRIVVFEKLQRQGKKALPSGLLGLGE